MESILAETQVMKEYYAGQSKNEKDSGIETDRGLEKETQRHRGSSVNPECKGSNEPDQEDHRMKRKMTELKKMLWGIEDE